MITRSKRDEKMKKNNGSKVRKLTIAGVLLALILIFLLVPIPSVTGVSYAVIALIAVIVACQFEGIWMGLFCGLSFGLASLIASFTTGAGSPLAIAFHNPLISIFPRVMIPITCYYSYIGLRKLFKFAYSKRKNYNEKLANHLSIVVSSGISAGIAVLTNTTLVLTMIGAFHAGSVLGNNTIGTAYLWGVAIAGAPLELAVCIPVSPAIVVALMVAFHKLNDKYSPRKTMIKVSTDIVAEQMSERDTFNQNLSELSNEQSETDTEVVIGTDNTEVTNDIITDRQDDA